MGASVKGKARGDTVDEGIEDNQVAGKTEPEQDPVEVADHKGPDGLECLPVDFGNKHDGFHVFGFLVGGTTCPRR